MTILDLLGFLIGALVARFSTFAWLNVLIVVLVVLVVLHWLMGERIPKLGRTAP